jgi:D-sedoheptulose 7-phosphate isomerase
MKINSIFQSNLIEHVKTVDTLYSLSGVIYQVGEVAARSIQSGGKVLFCGNGGSAADSQHLAAELTGRLSRDRRPLAGLALSTDTSAITCIGNDYSFNEVFARQLVGLGRSGDVLIGISTSGNSKNVIRAAEEARQMGITSIGLIGSDGGRLLEICDYSILVSSQITARIQECHILIGHTLCEIIEQKLGLV